METKICNTCKEAKPLADFRRHKRGGKPIINCLSCREAGKAQQNKEARRTKVFTEKYGITYGEYDEILSAQNGKCAICGSTDPKGKWKNKQDAKAFCVDHCHASGKVRGLLCNTCNQGLGNFFDNASFLQAAIIYLNQSG